MPADSIRTFIALEINEQIKEMIAQIQDKIRQANSLEGKWVTNNNIHLTLKFLGDTQLNDINNIKASIEKCLVGEKPIDCNLTNVGTFPNDRFPRVIWAGIKKGEEQIINLANKIEGSLRKLGFEKEKREFQAHLTICRVRQVLDRNQLKSTLEEINNNFSPQEFTINKITYFQSELTQQGPIYTSLSDYLLKQP